MGQNWDTISYLSDTLPTTSKMPSIIKSSVDILNVPKIRSSVSKISKPRKMKVKIVKEKTMKSVKSGGQYVGTGTSKYWSSDTKSYLCNICGKSFHTAKDRKRHEHIHDEEPYYCNSCDYFNLRQDHLTEHKRRNHGKSLAQVRVERKQAAIKPVSPGVECQTDFPF